MTPCRRLCLAVFVMFCVIGSDNLSARNDQFSLHALFGESELAANVNAVRRKAASLPIDERYEYLKHWVLPSDSHPDFRMTGEFTPTDPSPLAMRLEPYRFPTAQGGDLVSPVFDLLETAVALGWLDDLQAQIEQIADPPQLDQLRAKLALLLLVELESGKPSKSRDEAMSRLYKLTLETFKDSHLKDRSFAFWPELVLIVRAMSTHAEHLFNGDLLSALYAERASIVPSTLLGSHLHSIMQKFEEGLSAHKQENVAEESRLKNWIPVTQSIEMARGEGFPQTRWRLTDDHQVTLASGKHESYLIYRSPLAGRYEIVSEMGSVAICQILVGGQFYGTHGDGEHFVTGNFRQGGRLLEISYPTGMHESTIRYRALSDDRNVQVSVDGQVCVTYPHDEIPDPWIGVRSMPAIGSTYQNLVISGTPEIPDQIEMLTSESLTNWVQYYYFQEMVGLPNAAWNLVRDDIDRFHLLGRFRPALRGSNFESALMYHRPLIEDGSVEYDFWYEPGQFDAHPILDRLVFLIQPDGVRLHWLTDGKFDRTEVRPEHSLLEPATGQSPTALPLLPGAWNHLKLEIAGETVTLKLNGQRIYQRQLEQSNHRTFGLFHYKDQTALKVRKVVMRGDWPKSLPPIQQQELADPDLVELESGLTKLKSEFRHDFVRDGLPEKYFKLTGNLQTGVIAREDGVHVQLNSVAGTVWTVVAILPQFSLSGDFDIRAHFELKDLDTGWQDALAFLETRLADDQSHFFRALRGRQPDIGQNVRSQDLWGPLDQRRRIADKPEVCWAQSGCLRISRIGDRLFSSFAPNDSSVFRVLRKDSISDAEIKLNGIHLELALRGEGTGHVVWKDLSIRGERIQYLEPSPSPVRKLFSMRPDGSHLRLITEPKFNLNHLGSPEYSPDGSKIAIDMSTGGTTTSHIVLMNRDGTDPEDLGKGCMPSLSKSGKTVVFSAPGEGVVMMDLDGSNRKTIDRSGWGVQFSPDGKQIAYGSSSNITLMNVESNEKKPLMTGELAKRYSSIYWNLGWSHDNQTIAFKGRVRTTGQEELAVVALDKPDSVEILFSGTGINPDFTFSPDNQSVLFAKNTPGRPGPQLYLAHRKTPGEIELLKGQPADQMIYDCAWSPDGREIVFSSVRIPGPVDWPIGSKSLPSGPDTDSGPINRQ